MSLNSTGEPFLVPPSIRTTLQPQDIFDRLSKDPDQVAKRPLLSGEDPLGKLEALMETRRPQYAQVNAERVGPFCGARGGWWGEVSLKTLQEFWGILIRGRLGRGMNLTSRVSGGQGRP